jgi:hypothetical protein
MCLLYADTDDFLEAEQAARLDEENRRCCNTLPWSMPCHKPLARGHFHLSTFGHCSTSENTSTTGHRGRRSPRTKQNLERSDAERVDAQSRKGVSAVTQAHAPRSCAVVFEQRRSTRAELYRGLFNLAVIILAVSNARLILEQHYGSMDSFLEQRSHRCRFALWFRQQVGRLSARERNLWECTFLSC